MFERFAPDARTVVFHAQDHARRLGHNFVGCEHLLLAILSTDQPASAVLRERGVTPRHVEEEIVRQAGPGVGSPLFGTLNREALASVGIDLDAVRAKIEASFGPEALARADRAVYRESSPSHPRRAGHHGLVRHWRRRRHMGRAVLTAPAPTPTGQYQTSGARPTGHIPFTPHAKQSLANAVREARTRHDNHIGIEHLALGLLSVNRGPVRSVLSALDASAPVLRAAIADRYRKAS